MNDQDLIPLIQLMPDEWRGTAESCLLFLGSMTVIVAALKGMVPALRALALRTQSTRDDRAVSILSDVLVEMTRTFEWLLRIAQIIAGHRAPPMRAIVDRLKRSPLVAVMMVAMALIAPSYACAGSQVRTHAQIADALYGPILAAKQAIERRAYEQVDQIKSDSNTTEDSHRKTTELRDRFRRVEGAMVLVIDGYNAYVDAIKAANANASDLRAETARALLTRWQSLLRAARDIGIQLDEIPSALVSMSP